MLCNIYRSSKRDEMYLYIAYKDNASEDELWSAVSESVRNAFGRATFVMQLDLSQRERLARVSILQVLDALTEKGFFIQMPPDGLINPNAVAPEGLRGA